MVEIEELRPDADPGPSASDVAGMIDRARRLTPSQAHALAGAVAWRWTPLAIPGSGSLVAARAAATAAARGARRAEAAAAAEAEARRAATESPGGQSIGGRWSLAEDGIAAVVVGVIGVAVAAGAGQQIIAVAFALAALGGVVLLVLFESRAVTRARLLAAVDAAALAIVVRDLVDPGAFDTLHGPWATVMRD